MGTKTGHMAKDDRDIRFKLGEYYKDLLVTDGFLRGNSPTQQAESLLGAKLQEREEKIIRRVNYLAWKRGITPAQMWLDIQEGKAKSITPEELAAIREQGLIDESGDVPGLDWVK